MWQSQGNLISSRVLSTQGFHPECRIFEIDYFTILSTFLALRDQKKTDTEPNKRLYHHHTAIRDSPFERHFERRTNPRISFSCSFFVSRTDFSLSKWQGSVFLCVRSSVPRWNPSEVFETNSFVIFSKFEVVTLLFKTVVWTHPIWPHEGVLSLPRDGSS